MKKREDLIPELLMGRSMLMRAIGHIKSYSRIDNLECDLIDSKIDHIGVWKAAGKEHGFGNCDDEKFEMMECPRCSAQYGALKAKKVMAGRCGRINGILTRMGNSLRAK